MPASVEEKMNLSVRWKWFFGVGLLLVSFAARAETLLPPASASTPTTHRGEPTIQEKRLAVIKNAVEVGFITKIDDKGPLTRVLAGQNFFSLSFQEKEDLLNVVWAYYKTHDPEKNVVLLIDQRSGKTLGEYSLANGGLKMK